MKFSVVGAQLAADTGQDADGARGPGGQIGAARVALLEAIRDHGSISAGAKAVGIGFRSAWDAVATLNNLFATPLVIARPGGRDGGGAELTPEGREVVAVFRGVEAALSQVVAQAGAQAGPDASAMERLLWSVNMRSSARNALAGTVVRITDGGVDAEVVLRLADGVELAAVITTRSLHDLGLAVGSQAVALIKASFVILARAEEVGRTSARNRLEGQVIAREDTAVTSEIVLDLGGGKSLAATITRGSADALALALGDRMCALIKAPHVILAVP